MYSKQIIAAPAPAAPLAATAADASPTIAVVNYH